MAYQPENIDDVIINLLDPLLDKYNELNLPQQKDQANNSANDIAPSIDILMNDSTISKQIDKIYHLFEEQALTDREEFTESRQELIKTAMLYSIIAHGNDPRKTGGYYFKHVFDVATYLAKEKWGSITIASAFLHDTVEDRVKKHKFTKEDEKENSDHKEGTYAKINGQMPRKHYLNDISKTFSIVSEKDYDPDKGNILFKDEVDRRIKKITESYKGQKLNDFNEKRLRLLIGEDIKNSFTEIIRRLTHSEADSYERYSGAIKEKIGLSTLKQRRRQRFKSLEAELMREYEGLNEAYDSNFSDITDFIIRRTAAVKAADRINNIETLDVIETDMRRKARNSIKRYGPFSTGIYLGLAALGSGKKAIVRGIEKLIDNHKGNLNSFMKKIREFGHDLGEQHYLTAIFTEIDLSKGTRKLNLDSIKKGYRTAKEHYKSFSQDKRYDEIWKNINIIDTLKYTQFYKGLRLLLRDLEKGEPVLTKTRELVAQNQGDHFSHFKPIYSGILRNLRSGKINHEDVEGLISLSYVIEENEKRDYAELGELYENLITTTLKTVEKDIRHRSVWHLEKREVFEAEERVKTYESPPINGLDKMTKPKGDERLDGLYQIVKSRIEKKEDLDRIRKTPIEDLSFEDKRIKEIENMLMHDDQFQLEGLLAAKRIIEKYRDQPNYKLF